jgi:predicted small lipoprotein YifL
MRYTAIAAMTLAVTLPILGGCGQMGPLYMPTEEEQLSKPAEQTSQPQQKTDAP